MAVSLRENYRATISLNLTNPISYSYAIKGSPNQKLLLEDIYYAIESRVGI